MTSKIFSKNFLLIFALLFISVLSAIPSIKAENDDDLAIRENDSYMWTVTTFDYDKYEEGYGSSLTTEVGVKIIIDIEYIYAGDYYWELEIEKKEYKNFANIAPSEIEYNYKIGFSGENYTFGDYFLQRDAKAYLDEWELPSDNYSVSGLKVTYENSVSKLEISYVYQANGVLFSYTVKYDGEDVYVLQFGTGTISFGYYFIVFTAIGIIGILIIYNKKYRGGIQK